MIGGRATTGFGGPNCGYSKWLAAMYICFHSNTHVVFSTRRSESEKSLLKASRMMGLNATASRASPSISATHLISSAAASGRASASWRSTRWCGHTPLCDHSFPGPTGTLRFFLRPGGCNSDISWRHRGGSHQVSWPGICRRL